VTVSFVELAGDACSDMLNGGRALRLMTGPDGVVHPFPAVEVACADADELIAIIAVSVS
jgi:hypothetical protein